MDEQIPIAPENFSSLTPPGGSRKWIFIVVGVIVLLTLVGAGYYLLGQKKNQTNSSRLSQAWLTQYFNVHVCVDISTCGEMADPDNDGLPNYYEFQEETDPVNPDFDGDGLADGDEVNIYNTDPTLKFTDKREVVASNNWTDGYQIKNGYDPLTPAQPLTSTRKQQIEEAISKFKLHELIIETTTSTSWKIYKNTELGFEFEYPSNLYFSGSLSHVYDFKKQGEVYKGEGGKYYEFAFIVLKNDKNLSAEQFFARNKVTGKSEEINGYKTFEFQTNDNITIVEIYNSDKVGRFYVEALSTLTSSELDHIISTFKFTETTQNTNPNTTAKPSEITSSWKIYHNDKYEFEVQYPSNWVVDNYTYPVDSFSFSSPEFQSKNVIGEISVNFTK